MINNGFKKFGLSLVVVASFLLAYWRNHTVDDGALPALTATTLPTDTTNSMSSQTDISQTPPVAPATETIPPSSTTSLTPTTPTSTTKNPVSMMMGQGKYRNGTYTGSVADAFYGNVQVKVTVQSGKVTQVNFLDYPHDRSTSVSINSYATPLLAQQAVQAQSANVDGVSGASATSEAFRQSLASALAQAAA